ncbi:hypothetical protein SPBR_04404 [Sporothrix brasiliensis 5110]|uniref:Enoyl-CoA hydratase n=1 Tax=Sporothrix brasiliensis 5110 TaxID=1398154 RepID=A0A0C2J2M8_9PEZI|nr:uncharacterized protein SPBR_04404 [Sporothrix brasiliensis 5110]KIH93295.1 hypothetical protein SPBR_04404 [Sporothrix brasiliensis 5110]
MSSPYATFQTPPPETTILKLTFPAPYVLLVTINREKAMNSITMAGHWEGDAVWTWFDEEPELRVAILTGAGTRSFSAGADLKEVNRTRGKGTAPVTLPTGSFLGFARRLGKKPVIGAVNGYAYGGGFELALNCDMVLASPTATFSLPEASRGLYAAAGGLAHAVRNFGMQLAGEIALAGRIMTAQELERLGFCRVSKTQASLIDEAVALAKAVGQQSPDALIVTRSGLRQAWETGSVERAAQITEERYGKALMDGENMKIGTAAFARKEQPKWVPSKL